MEFSSFFLSIAGLGFLLGMRHATDADHVVAVTTIVSKQKKIRHAALIGIYWGIGHSITVTAIALPIMLFSFVIPPRVGLGFEFLVGFMLTLLGILNLTGITARITNRFTPTIHSHTHNCPEGGEHKHVHAHFDFFSESTHHLGLFNMIRPLFIGLVHGLAGSAAIALLILSTIKNAKLAAMYLFIFHFGVISGMMLITTAFGASIMIMKKKSEVFHKYLVLASGILSFFFGLYIMYQTGFVDGLFSSSVHWTPK